jgi:hypothetical protein
VTQFIALLALIVIAVGLQFANYWYTFGLWPTSWTSFVVCGLASMVVSGLISAVIKDKD